METRRIKTDFLMIGSGISALNFALRVSNIGDVLILTKKERTDANTNYAQGGVASVLGKTDSYSSHIEDTLRTGAGICREKAVDIMVKEGPPLIDDLIGWGVEFSRDKNSNLELWKEGGHSHRRIVHAGDFTGREIEKALISSIKNHPNIRIFEHHLAFELITANDSCYGAFALDVSTGEIIQVCAKVTLLATGGAGQVYQHTSNPTVATGDGISMAYNAGCRIEDMEFFQFHPTTLWTPKVQERQFLISEAVRGEGGILLDKDGNRFMEGIDPGMELAPRDVVARACDSVLKERGDDYVLLDISHKDSDKVKKKFPNIYRECLKHSIDMTKEPIPVVPAAHYICGGVCTDLYGGTDLRGLLAAGEVAFTGVHGANRLASNSLLEALVFSTRASRIAEDWMVKDSFPEECISLDKKRSSIEESILAVHTKKEIKQTMWDYVGIVRRDYLLNRALRRFELYLGEIEELYRNSSLSRDIIELRSLITVAYLITRSALLRKESRGLHYNKDHPQTKEEFRKHIIQRKEK
ncbi:MAG: L-aspartate oxidase [candidate division WOR-3 bacterium]|nr:L-aspartate oxidase [candidate division WOR-3 bacterium]